MSDREHGVSLWFDGTVRRVFGPDIRAFCDILLKKVVPLFDDVEGEQQRAGDEYLANYPGGEEDYEAAMEQAYHHGIDHALRFEEMGSVFLAVGVSGLFHLFEKQVYEFANRELRRTVELSKPVAYWNEIENLMGKLVFRLEGGEVVPCRELALAFESPDIQELQALANAVKHGEDGPSYRKLLAMNSPVVSPARVERHMSSFSTLKVAVSVTPGDVVRYRDAIMRFWSVEGEYWAPVSAFKNGKI